MLSIGFRIRRRKHSRNEMKFHISVCFVKTAKYNSMGMLQFLQYVNLHFKHSTANARFVQSRGVQMDM